MAKKIRNVSTSLSSKGIEEFFSLISSLPQQQWDESWWCLFSKKSALNYNWQISRMLLFSLLNVLDDFQWPIRLLFNEYPSNWSFFSIRIDHKEKKNSLERFLIISSHPYSLSWCSINKHHWYWSSCNFNTIWMTIIRLTLRFSRHNVTFNEKIVQVDILTQFISRDKNKKEFISFLFFCCCFEMIDVLFPMLYFDYRFNRRSGREMRKAMLTSH